MDAPGVPIRCLIFCGVNRNLYQVICYPHSRLWAIYSSLEFDLDHVTGTQPCRTSDLAITRQFVLPCYSRTILKYFKTIFNAGSRRISYLPRARTSAFIQAHANSRGFPCCRFFCVLVLGGRGRSTGQICYATSITAVFLRVFCWGGRGTMRGMYFDSLLIQCSFLCCLLLLYFRFTRTRPIWKATRSPRAACGPSTTSS